MKSKPILYSTAHATPVGELTLIASDRGLRAILWPKESTKRIGITGRARRDPNHRIIAATARQLDEYFAGNRIRFHIPLDLEGTPFQVTAWHALAGIPFGTTTTYGAQAASLGIPSAARAVGAANRANPVCIILPCHRVIGADGSLTGFAGGLPLKRWLIDHEASVLARRSEPEVARAIDSNLQWQMPLSQITRSSMPVA
jgi:methylated-DNA-[protein]-cysteine S-methyltransferase